MRISKEPTILTHIQTNGGDVFCWKENHSVEEIQQIGKRIFEKGSVVNFLKKLAYEIDEISYYESGQPYLKAYPESYISISHSDTFFAVYLAKNPCGIDIQVPFPKMNKVFHLYCNEAESQFSDSFDFKHLIWCAKEAAYKKHGGKFTNLQLDFTVLKIDEKEQLISLKTPMGIEEFTFLQVDTFYLVYSN